jgi:hypothetical protein
MVVTVLAIPLGLETEPLLPEREMGDGTVEGGELEMEEGIGV